MSLTKLVFPCLNWAELSEILNFLTLRELWVLGCTCRTAFVTFMREKSSRDGLLLRNQPNMFSSHARFLSKYSAHDKILLVSYPRSGNSYVRKKLEVRTGIVTGSDSRPNRTLSASLLRFGYRGEGVTDQSVWVVKSHYPERLGYIRVNVQRVVLVVRNPFDSIESYFHMGMTNTHDKVLTSEAFNSLLPLWKEFVANEANVWTVFHQFWLQRCAELPIFIVRYEDLLQNEDLWLSKVEAFLKEGNPPVGLSRYWKGNQDNVDLQEKEQGLGYKPKNRKIGKALVKMSVDSAKDVERKTKDLMELFGYKLVQTKEEADSSDLASDQFELQITECEMNQEKETIFHRLSTGKGVLIVNNKLEIREPDDNFGRKITEVRQKYTLNDKNPFPTL